MSTLAQRRAGRVAATRRLRRKHWGQECRFCAYRWHRAKSNWYVERSGTCQGCMVYLAHWCKRGAAAIIARSTDVGILISRLKDVSPQSRKLSSIRGGKR